MKHSPGWQPLQQFGGKIGIHSETGRLRWEIPAPVLPLPSGILFYLVRHGETPANQMQIFQGSDKETEWTKLSEKGHAQSRTAARALCEILQKNHAGIPVEVICSPAKRARETAEHFLKQAQIEPAGLNILECLNEIKFGEMTGKTLDEICSMGAEHARFIDEYRRQGNATVRAGGSESFLDVLARVYTGLSAWSRARAPRPAVVVAFTHMITACAVRVLFADQALLEEDPACGPFIRWRQIMHNAEPHHWHSGPQIFKSVLP